MVCRNCGKPIFDGDDFCTFCGAKAPGAGTAGTDRGGMNTAYRPGGSGSAGVSGAGGMGTPPYNTGAYAAPAGKKGGNKTPLFVAAGAAAVLLVGGIGGYFLYTANDYKRPLKLMVKSMEKGDGDKMLSAIHPEMLSVMLKEQGISKKELVSQYEAALGLADLAGDVKVDYDIIDTDDWSKSEVKDYEESFAYDGCDIDIDAVKTIEAEMTTKFAGMEETEKATFVVFKADGKWYMGF